jgi:ATP-dependent Clp protease ATP-binding subunit ClpC
MSEFSERHTASRLVGAPAGYVGYEDGGQLTDKIRRQPYSVVLFDEIEKAHPDVFNMLLQLLEDGVISDAKGRKVDFTNTIVIMTSNIGAQKLQKEAHLGFSADDDKDFQNLDELHAKNQEDVRGELKKLMRPELINRIDKTIVFRALTKPDALQIVDLQLDELRSRLVRRGISIIASKTAKEFLVEKGYDAKNGARPIRRLIQEEIENHLADKLISDELPKGSVVKISVKNDKLDYSISNEPKTSKK